MDVCKILNLSIVLGFLSKADLKRIIIILIGKQHEIHVQYGFTACKKKSRDGSFIGNKNNEKMKKRQ